MARAELRVGDLVRLSSAGIGWRAAPRLITGYTFVVWASHVKLLRPRKRLPREREPIEDEETDQ